MVAGECQTNRHAIIAPADVSEAATQLGRENSSVIKICSKPKRRNYVWLSNSLKCPNQLVVIGFYSFIYWVTYAKNSTEVLTFYLVFQFFKMLEAIGVYDFICLLIGSCKPTEARNGTNKHT